MAGDSSAMQRGARADREGGAQHGAGAGAAANRAPARSWSRAPSTTSATRADGPSSRSTAAPSPSSCSRPSSSATARAPSPARPTTATASSRPRAAARCSSTRSATCRWRCRASCCARSRSARCGRSARSPRSRSNVRIVSATHKDLGAEVHGRPLPPGPVLPAERDPDRACRRCASGSRTCRRSAEHVLERIARDAGVASSPRLTRAALAAPDALCLSGQCARTGEPAASRRRAVRRRHASTSPTWACPSCCWPTARTPTRPATGACRTVPDAPAAPAIARRAAAERPRSVPRRGRARHPRARAGAAPLQPHRGRREPGPDPAPDALSHGAARRESPSTALGRRSARAATSHDASPARAQREAALARRLVARRAAHRLAELRSAAGRRRGRPGVIHSISLPPGEYGGDAIERLFTNRLDWRRASLFRAASAGSRSRRISSSAATASCCSSCRCDERAWHAGASQLARPRRTATTTRSASSSRGSKARRSSRRSTRRLARAAARAARSAIRSRTSPATSTSRRAASSTPAPASTGRAARRLGWPAAAFAALAERRASGRFRGALRTAARKHHRRKHHALHDTTVVLKSSPVRPHM